MTNLPENCLEYYSIVLNFDNKMVKILAAEYDPNMFIKNALIPFLKPRELKGQRIPIPQS